MKTFCSYYNQGTCSSCNRIEIDYAQQVQSKAEKLNLLLKDFLPFEHRPPVKSSPVRFRNKAKFSITGTVNTPIIGLTGETELDQGREILDCSLHHQEINDLAQWLPEFIKLANLMPYQIKSKTGELKGVIIYFSSETKEMYLRLILRSKESLDRIKKHADKLQSSFPQVTCLSANIQPIAHAILEGEEEIFFSKQEYINHSIGDVKMTLHPQGFVQTNQEMAAYLYSTAAAWTQEFAPETFMELFSGQGAFSFFIQKFVSKAIGVEINVEAVTRANLTAREAGWDHLHFIAEDAAKVAEVITAFGPDLILVNPPRRGLGKACELFKKVTAKYIIYSSCSAETLALDLLTLKNQFSVVRAQVFDMFPNTDHFETLVLLKANSACETA